MLFSSPAYSGPKETAYLFIDGAYLRELLDQYGRDFFTLEEGGLPVRYEQLSLGFTKVFYYDCPPAQRPSESSDEFATRVKSYQAFVRHLRSLHGWHVSEGILKRRARGPFTQKEVDILIAVDTLTHVHRRNMHRMALIAGDVDFRPLVEAIVREGMFVELWYERATASSELLDAADARKPLDPYVLFDWLEGSFRRAFPLPSRESMDSKRIYGRTPFKAGKDRDGHVVEAYQVVLGGSQETYVYVKHNPAPSHFVEYVLGDLKRLERVYEQMHGPVQWT